MTADEQRCLDEFGYAVLPAGRAALNGILLHLETLFERAGQNAGHALRDKPFARVLDISIGEAGVFAPLTRDTRALECVQHRLGPAFELAVLHAASLNPFALALGPPRPARRPAACRVFWMLDDFTAEGTAALRVIPGSHLVQPSSGTAFEESAVAALTGGAGIAIFLDGRLWTTSGSNPTNRHLRMLICDYEPK